MDDLDQISRDALGTGFSVVARPASGTARCSFSNAAEATDVRSWMEWVKATTGVEDFALEKHNAADEVVETLWSGTV